jgi:hypothetical protein
VISQSPGAGDGKEEEGGVVCERLGDRSTLISYYYYYYYYFFCYVLIRFSLLIPAANDGSIGDCFIALKHSLA